MARAKQEMVSFEDQMKDMAVKSAQNEIATGGAIISLRGGVLSFMGEPMPDNQLDAVILGSSGEHSYYDTPFDPDNITAPVCFSVFELDANPVPHEVIQEPQGDFCKTCPMHQFKSAPNGRGRACSVRRRLALLPASVLDSDDEDALGGADIAIMKVPPTSVQSWGKYVNTVTAKFQRPPFMVVTRIKVKPHPKWQFTVEFDTTELIDKESFPTLMAMSEGIQGTLMAPFDMSGPEEKEEPEELKTTTRKKRTSRR